MPPPTVGVKVVFWILAAPLAAFVNVAGKGVSATYWMGGSLLVNVTLKV